MATKKGSNRPAKIAYSVAAAGEDGVVFSAQSAAGRTDKAAVIVRYASQAMESPGTIVHEHSAKFHSLWIDPDDCCHAVSQDGSWHSNVGGAWKSERVTKKPLVAVGGGPDFVLASGNGPKLFVCRGGTWAEESTGFDTGGTSFFGSYAVAGTELYVAGSGTLAHFDGKEWKKRADVGYATAVVAFSADDVFVVGANGLYRGNARDGFAQVAAQKLQYACSYRGDVFCCAYGGGVYRFRDGALESTTETPFAVGALTGGSTVLCALSGMQDGLWLYDGSAWTKHAPA